MTMKKIKEHTIIKFEKRSVKLEPDITYIASKKYIDRLRREVADKRDPYETKHSQFALYYADKFRRLGGKNK